MSRAMNVSIAVNEKYVRYAYVMLTSLFENHRDRQVNVFVLFSDVKDESICMLKKLGSQYGQKIYAEKIDAGSFQEQLPRNSEWTIETYYRLALADILPKEIKRVLYLDVDIIVRDSIWDFYNTDFKGKSLCACPDVSAAEGFAEKQMILFRECLEKADFQYFNAGVLLMNLEKLRQNYSLEKFLDIALKLPLSSPDQDLLNYLFHEDVILKSEERYNLFAKTAYCKGIGAEWVREHTAVIHYAGRKPWQHEALHYTLERFWWEYAKRTPFYQDLLEELVLNEIDSCFMDQLVRKMEEEKKELIVTLEKCMEVLKRMG